MRILFAGTPSIAVPSLAALAGRFEVAGVLTAPDKPTGRGRRPVPPPVKEEALRLGLPVIQPPRLGAEARAEAAALGADFLAVFAYGRIFGPAFLGLFPSGAVNLHPSALPALRGPSPLTAAILAGLERTALTVQTVGPGMDAGDILLQEPLDLDGRETTGSLTDRVAIAAAPLLVRAVEGLAAGALRGVPQDHRAATYCRLVEKDDGRIDWSLPAVAIERMIRAYQPWPRAATVLRGEPLFLLESRVPGDGGGPATPGTVTGVDKSSGILVQTGQGILAVTRLQLASRKPLDFRSFANGVEIAPGTTLGEQP